MNQRRRYHRLRDKPYSNGRTIAPRSTERAIFRKPMHNSSNATAFHHSFRARSSLVDDSNDVLEMDVDMMMTRHHFLDPPNVDERSIEKREGIPRDYECCSRKESCQDYFRSNLNSENRARWEVTGSIPRPPSSSSHHDPSSLVSPPRLPRCASRNEYEQYNLRHCNHHSHHNYSRCEQYVEERNDTEEKREYQSESMRQFPVQSHQDCNPVKTQVNRLPFSLCCHQIIGHPSQGIHRLRLPTRFFPLLDKIVVGCEEYSTTLTDGWHTDLYSLTKQDIALREIPELYGMARPIMYYISRAMSVIYGFRSIKVDRNQPHVLKYSGSHKGVELHHDKSDITVNIMLSRSNTYEGGGTIFPEANQNVRLEFGEFLLHPGSAVHGGTPISQGSRYLMVIFANEKA